MDSHLTIIDQLRKAIADSGQSQYGLLKTAVNHSPHCVPFVFHPRTPKALDNTAQGCEATLGPGSDVAHQPRRGCTAPARRLRGVQPRWGWGTRCPPTQGSFATLGCVVKPLRG